jgi:hypothetical protein
MVFTSSFHLSRASNRVTYLVSALMCFNSSDTCKNQYRCIILTVDSTALMLCSLFNVLLLTMNLLSVPLRHGCGARHTALILREPVDA